MERVKKATEKSTTTTTSDNITLSLPRLSTINFPTLLFFLFIFVAGALVGSLYTKINPHVLGVTTAAIPTSPPTTGTNPTAPTTAPQFVDVKNGKLPVLGDENAPVTVIEFADFRCPFCEQLYTNVLLPMKKDYVDNGKVKFYFRHYAFLGPASTLAANATECANEQGKFWDMYNYLYENQPPESDTSMFTVEKMSEVATTMGMDSGAFTTCLEDTKDKQNVLDDFSEGQKAGVSATPTVFVNGQRVEGAQPYSVFKTLIDAELAKAK